MLLTYMRFTEQGLSILEFWKDDHTIKAVSQKFDISYYKIKDNYLKKYIKYGYVDKIGKGRYILSKKGKSRLVWVKESDKIEKVILSLVQQGKSNIEIITNIYKQFGRKLTISAVSSKVMRLRKKNNIHPRNQNKCQIPKEFSEELAEFLGLVFSDGHVNQYIIYFINKDEALLTRFKELARTLFDIDIKRRERPFKIYESKIYSTNVSKYIQKLIQNKTTIPNEIINSEKLSKSFLKGYFSGDGCAAISISFKKSKNKFEVYSFLAIACRRRNITEQLAELLYSLGISKVAIDDAGLKIIRRKDIQTFYNKIGFVDGCKIRQSQYWRGFKKNQVLKYIATQLPDQDLFQICNTNKDNIINYIQSKLLHEDLNNIAIS
jgi:hypothetical protein